MSLKFCPFCASDNVALMREGKGKTNIAYRVSCRDCLARGPKFWVKPWHYGNKRIAQAQAIAHWNNRPTT